MGQRVWHREPLGEEDSFTGNEFHYILCMVFTIPVVKSLALSVRLSCWDTLHEYSPILVELRQQERTEGAAVCLSSAKLPDWHVIKGSPRMKLLLIASHFFPKTPYPPRVVCFDVCVCVWLCCCTLIFALFIAFVSRVLLTITTLRLHFANNNKNELGTSPIYPGEMRQFLG